MAAQSIHPIAVFPGITVDSTGFTIPYADLPGLTQAEANATTGNVAEIMRNLLEKLNTVYTAVASADKPVQLSLTKASVISGGVQKDTFTVGVGVTAAASAFSAISEP